MAFKAGHEFELIYFTPGVDRLFISWVNFKNVNTIAGQFRKLDCFFYVKPKLPQFMMILFKIMPIN
jgi:hypothetical protein